MRRALQASQAIVAMHGLLDRQGCSHAQVHVEVNLALALEAISASHTSLTQACMCLPGQRCGLVIVQVLASATVLAGCERLRRFSAIFIDAHFGWSSR